MGLAARLGKLEVLVYGPPPVPLYGGYATREELTAAIRAAMWRREPHFTLLGKSMAPWCWLAAGGELRDDEQHAEDFDG